MKKYFVVCSAVVIAAVTLVSCSKNTPKDVAKEWLTDFFHQDFDAAKKLSTDNTKDLINTLQGFTGAMADSVKQNAKKITVVIKDVKEEGDKATVTFYASDQPTKDEVIHLEKHNDKWQVQFSKMDWIGGSEAKPDANNNNNGVSITVGNNGAAATPAADSAPAITAPDTAKH